MRPIDRPDLTRRLTGVDHALADGSARRPGDLLDQLRERLDRLDPSHPSATRQAEPGELTDRGELAEPGGVAEPGGATDSGGAAEPGFPDSRRDEGVRAHRESGRQPERGGHGDSGEGSTGPRADQPAAAPAGGSAVGAPVADSEFRTIDVARAETRERYRPWFAADDERGTPWFIE